VDLPVFQTQRDKTAVKRPERLIVQAMGGLKGGGLKLLCGSPVSGRNRRVFDLNITLIVKALIAMTLFG